MSQLQENKLMVLGLLTIFGGFLVFIGGLFFYLTFGWSCLLLLGGFTLLMGIGLIFVGFFKK